MAEPPGRQLQAMLQASVQSVQWTYSLFWQICPQRGTLVWADGYYNGAIKTRKTVQPMEVSSEEASLQRSQQLRELYESLSAGETNQPARRPCAALSPEDLTESEWFYLMCVSFTFAPGVGLPGKAYSRRQHVWLTGAHEADSKVFSRAILAKSARIQTVVCVPLMDGVVEFGNTDKVQEDIGFVNHVKTFFADHHHRRRINHPHPPPPKPALSEHSTSNPAPTSSDNHPRFSSPLVPPIYASADPPPIANQDEDDDEDDEEEDDEEADSDSDSEAETVRNQRPPAVPNPQGTAAAEASELMQLEMPEDIRLGSPDDGSNNLETDFHLPAVTHSENHNPNQRRDNSHRGESTPRWPLVQDPSSSALQPPPSSEEEDTHYSQTVSTILQNQSNRWAEPSSRSSGSISTQSAFAKWTIRSEYRLHTPMEGSSQWLLKYILFTVPFLHSKYHDENSPKSRDAETATRFRKGTPQDELSANHVLAERRRREKLNERFVILRSLVPFVTKMDKASILGDTIEYVKVLRKKIQDLESRNRQMETDHRSRVAELQTTNSAKETRSGDRTRVGSNLPEKRKMIIMEGRGGTAKAKPVESSPPPATSLTSSGLNLEVSIIESDALLELQCPYKEGLLLDVMQLLRELRIETTAVQSSLNSGVIAAELRAKVKENVIGKKPSIVEVKRAVQQIIQYTDAQ